MINKYFFYKDKEWIMIWIPQTGKYRHVWVAGNLSPPPSLFKIMKYKQEQNTVMKKKPYSIEYFFCNDNVTNSEALFWNNIYKYSNKLINI